MGTTDKKRIFISMHYMELGGAETALIGMLQTLDPNRVSVDLFLHAHRGEMMQFIPEWVNILPEIPAYKHIETSMRDALIARQLKVVAARLYAKWKHSRFVKKQKPIDGNAIFGYIGKYTSKILPTLYHLGEYDLAVSYLTPHNIVLDNVKAKKKICWIHTDYTRVAANPDIELPIWGGYDNIISISPDVTESFCKIFPSLRHKIIEMENIISPEFINKRADMEPAPAEMQRFGDETILLTIGRFCYQKNLESIPAICRGLIDAGLNIRWYIIGYGGSDDYIRKEIEANGMQNNVVILGKKSNPYPYIKACDWYVQPSRYEGKSITVREAQLLHKPVIITNYPTAASQITHGLDGLIVPLELTACTTAILDALNDNTTKRQIIQHLSSNPVIPPNILESLM